jgi:hypothetical protein
VKSIESPWVENRDDECGDRSDRGCGQRPDGLRRLDLMGSSTSQRYLVPYTAGATLADSLRAQCGQDVQVENMAMTGYAGEVRMGLGQPPVGRAIADQVVASAPALRGCASTRVSTRSPGAGVSP